MTRTHHEARGKGLHAGGVIALAATAIAGAAALVLLRTRAGQEARARLRDGDLGRRLQDTMDDVQRVADRGAALLERAAAAVREAARSRPGMLDVGARKDE
jgi:hypothetical protein